MPGAQPANGADLVGRVVVNVHARMLLPPAEHPVHESFKGDLFPVSVVCPPVLECERIGGLSSGAGAEQIFQPANHQRVAELAPNVDALFTYEYDFGDCWEHDVLLEKILPPDKAFKHPVCLGGANACPPEDCGGSSGYADYVEAMADPKHPEHESMVNWNGSKWDATLFSIEAANTGLKRIKA